MPATAPLRAADIMNSDLRTCSVFSSVLEAAMIIREVDCGIVPVVEGGRAVGLLTDRDIVLGLTDDPDVTSRPVADVMTKEVVSVGPETPLDAVLARLRDQGLRRLLVIDGDRLVGIISHDDIVRHINAQDLDRPRRAR